MHQGNYREQFSMYRNNPSLCYLDYAATTFMSDSVVSTWQRYHSTVSIAAGRSKSFLGEQANIQLQKSRQTLKTFFNVPSSHDFVFTKNATESLNIAAYGIQHQLQKGDLIVLSVLEHHSNLIVWQQIVKQTGAIVVMIPLNNDGSLCYELLDELLSLQVKVVSLSLVSNVTGHQLDTEKIKHFVQKTNAIYILDISQAVAHNPVDCQQYKADMYALSAHKMYGPKNIGGLIIDKALLSQLKPTMYGGGMVWNTTGINKEWADGPAKLEAGTFDVGLAVAWTEACKFLDDQTFSYIHQNNKTIYDLLYTELQQIDGLQVIKAGSMHSSAILTFAYEKMHSHDLERFLSEQQVIIRTGHMCSQNTLQALGYVSLNRLSWGVGTTLKDAEQFVTIMKKVAENDGKKFN